MEPGRRSRLGAIAVDVRPLAHPDFRRLFLGQSVSMIGFQLTAVAVSLQMYDITRSSLWVGLLGLAVLVPLVVFGLYGGSVSDAVDRRRLLVASSYLVWFATGGLFVQAVLDLDNRWLLFALVALQSVGFAFTSPTRGAVIPRSCPASGSDRPPAGRARHPG